MLTRLALIGVGVVIVAQTPVFAYTDPGSGTLILQMLVAAAFGVMFYLRRIINWFRSLKPHTEQVKAAKSLPKTETEKESKSIKI